MPKGLSQFVCHLNIVYQLHSVKHRFVRAVEYGDKRMSAVWAASDARYMRGVFGCDDGVFVPVACSPDRHGIVAVQVHGLQPCGVNLLKPV